MYIDKQFVLSDVIYSVVVSVTVVRNLLHSANILKYDNVFFFEDYELEMSVKNKIYKITLSTNTTEHNTGEADIYYIDKMLHFLCRDYK